MIISRRVLLRIKNISDELVQKIKTHILYSIFFFFFENEFFMWKSEKKKIIERGRPQMTIWRTNIASLIPKAKNTHSEYATLIPLPLQQLSHERASLLRYTIIACLVVLYIISSRKLPRQYLEYANDALFHILSSLHLSPYPSNSPTHNI